jgi:hypothetical protein
MRANDSEAQHGRDVRVQNQSRSRMAPSREGNSIGSVVDTTTLRELTRENSALKKIISGISHEEGTGSQNRQSAQRIKVPTPTLPAGEETRCGLLSQPHEIIEITSDDDDNSFVR